MSRWKRINLDRVPASHDVGFAPDLTPIAHARGKTRTHGLCWALGCMHPLVVPMTKLRHPSKPNCSCHDS